MNITLLGSGNVATVLAKLSVQKGHNIKQVIARNIINAAELAKQVGAVAGNIADCVIMQADLVIIALSDSSVAHAITGLHFREIPVVHTAGAVSIDVLKNIANNYGALYPLQSLRKEMETIPQIPFLIEANNEKTLGLIRNFATTVSDNVKEEGGENRLKLHAAAVVVNNFTNYLYNLAEDFCKKENVDFDLLKPLIKETAERIQQYSPSDLQTGPAVRQDINTLEKHLKLLTKYPKLHTMYKFMSDAISHR